jgi:hypothetical protein
MTASLSDYEENHYEIQNPDLLQKYSSRQRTVSPPNRQANERAKLMIVTEARPYEDEENY